MKISVARLFIIFVVIATLVSFRVLIFDLYKIPTNSMDPTLKSGDYVLVSKICSGPRILNHFKLIFRREVEYIWLKGIKQSISRNDILIFNYPQYEYLSDSIKFIYGTALVKRSYGVPGDSVYISRTDKEMGESDNGFNNIFPYDTTLHWKLTNIGPLYVPCKGDTLHLTPINIRHYYDVLLYENRSIQIRNDSIYLNGMYTDSYCFMNNYYYMLGDNFYNSRDSRYWGFLPETHIIGKVVLILFSLDPSKSWYNKFRLDRLLHKV